MKKVIVYVFALTVGVCSAAMAQDGTTTGQEIKKDAKKTGHAIKKGAVDAGNKTAELASKGAAKVKDKEYDGKTAPNGKTVYITKDGRYYWVDGKGRHQYVTEAELKDKS